jgi:hypothetical protein
VIGWTQSQEGVLAREGHRDIWYVVGARSVQEDKLTVQRFWLFGIQARQHALILQFVHPSAPPPTMTLATGMAFEGEVAFFESAAPLRGLIKSRKDIVGSVRLEFGTIAVGLASCAARLATQPWLVQQPLGIAEAYPSRRSNGQWCIVEKTSEHSLTVAPALSDQALWCLSAICGDHPASIFGEFDGSYFFPLGLCQDGKIEAI